MNTEEIKKIAHQLSYNQRINFLISYFMSNDNTLNRATAYEKALLDACENDTFEFYFVQTFELGPIFRY
ncbi:hypothetical protein HAU13_10005 [Weissella confusa]|uniref:hypothetical protein n=1 Tax=Weissella confusa TaxID=1583 RepID=UPI0018F1BD08|nr:hypothetical protein [Weissella confusa]MBJ7623065.1 hypothetical protein [Weissella confusa]